MSRRARALMFVLAARHLGMGVIALAWPAAYSSAAFAPVRTFGITGWGVVYVLIGAGAVAAAWRRTEQPARYVIGAAAALAAAWTTFFASAAYRAGHPVPALVWAVVFAGLCGLDLVASAMPLRHPFEDLVRQER